MKRTSLSPRFVKIPIRSPARSIAGPLVAVIFAPSSAATMCATVVLPSPGGPPPRRRSIPPPPPPPLRPKTQVENPVLVGLRRLHRRGRRRGRQGFLGHPTTCGNCPKALTSNMMDFMDRKLSWHSVEAHTASVVTEWPRPAGGGTPSPVLGRRRRATCLQSSRTSDGVLPAAPAR